MKLKGLKEFTMVNEAHNTMKLSVPKDIKEMNAIFKRAGHELYIVGGAVRDALMGKTPKDWDLATDAQPEKIKSILGKEGYKFVEIGEAFAIVFAIVGFCSKNSAKEVVVIESTKPFTSEFPNFVLV